MKPQYDYALLNFAFNVNLRRYTVASVHENISELWRAPGGDAVGLGERVPAALMSTAWDTHGEWDPAVVQWVRERCV